MAYFYIYQTIVPTTQPDAFQSFYTPYSSFLTQNQQFPTNASFALWNQSNFYETTQFCNPMTKNEEFGVQKETLIAQTGKFKKRGEKNLQKEILSAKKNSQSNIINQFYSFFSSQDKSDKIIERCCRQMRKAQEEIQKIKALFFMTIKFINAKRGRKYVNVAMLLKFFTVEEMSQYLPEIKLKLEGSCSVTTIDELCEVFRRCVKVFLKEVSICATLTSKRITIVSKEEHLRKRRKLLRSIIAN